VGGCTGIFVGSPAADGACVGTGAKVGHAFIVGNLVLGGAVGAKVGACSVGDGANAL
jgi:hypothetical protein